MKLFNQSKFIEELQKYINTFTTCYYEEAPKSASYPYCVLIPPTTTDLAYGDLIMFDIEIYANELTGAEETEQLCDTLRNNLDNYLLNSTNNFTSNISFETMFNLKDSEQDLLARRLTFSARVFYL